MVQRCKRFSSHFFTVILSVVLLAGFGGEAYGSKDDDHKKKGHHKEVRLQGNVKNINAKKTKFELCSDTECTKIKVTRKTAFMDVNGRASAFANLVVDDYITVTGRVRDKHHNKGKRHHDEDFSPRATVKAKTVEIGTKIRYLIMNGAVWNLPDAAARSFDLLDPATWTTACVTVPLNAEILLVTTTGTTAPMPFTDLFYRQTVEVHGHYDNAGSTPCFVARTVLATG